MTDDADFDHWSSARHSMRRLERSAAQVSIPLLAGASALGVAVALFLTLGVLLDVSLGRLRDSFGWTQHADAILFRIDDIQQSVFAGEANSRAFALTGDASNIAGLAAARAKWRASEKTLRNLVADNAGQQHRLDLLYPIVETRFARLTWFVNLPAAARPQWIAAAIKAGDAARAQQRRVSADIAARLGGFRATELNLLQARRGLAERDSMLLSYLSIIIALIAPLSAFGGLYLLFREHHRRRARELQLELIHTQRLALLGETASMLAHEINQPLAAATNYLAALNRLAAHPDTARPERVKEATQKAADQIARAVSIVQRLRNFIAKRDSDRMVESPSLLVLDAVALFGTLGMAAQLKTHVEPGLPSVLIDRVQIQQVMVNLMRNALEAMRDSAPRELDLDVIAAKDGAVQFCLRDTGPGLPKEVSEKLFRPFVSTKPDGMGVGLSICRKIVTDHGGHIWAVPAVGGGTLFCFTLPGVEREAPAKAA